MKRQKWLTIILAIILSVCLGLFGAACNSKKDDATLMLSQTKITLVEGNSTLISATTSESSVTWTTDASDVISITPIMKSVSVKALKKGTATLTATAGSLTATCEVTVESLDEQEKVEIKSNGTVVTSVTVEQGSTLQLTAAGTKGSAVTGWKTADEGTATVSDNGLVSGVFPGETTITAQVSSSLKAEVTVTVTAKAGSTAYNLKFGEEGGTYVFNETSGAFDGTEELENDEYFYWASRSGWGQNVEVSKAQYQDGVVSVAYTSNWNPGYWYGFQLIYKNSQQVKGNNYKLSCKINIKSVSEIDADTNEEKQLDSVNVTLNGNVITLNKGVNNVEVYYNLNAGLHESGISSFKLVMGVNTGDGNGTFVQNVDFEVSDVTWADDTPVQLQTPSFTLDSDNKITIADPNTAGVGGYTVAFINAEGTEAGSVSVTNGAVVDTSALGKGTYSLKIKAVGANNHYITSEYSAASGSITVTQDASYTLENSAEDGAVATPGVWTYWTSEWVGVTEKKFENNEVTLEFSNNSGNWYDTQLFYKSPTNVSGTIYKVTFTATLPENTEGRVTVCGTVITLKSGTNTYEVVTTEGSGASFVLVFGVNGENNQQEIQQAKVIISNVQFTEATAQQLTAPTFSIADNVITITDSANAAANVSKYELGFFSSETATEPTCTVTVTSGSEIDLSSVAAGTYTVKIRACGANALYTTSDWSTATAQVTSTTANVTENISFGENGTGKAAITTPDTWYYWNDQSWCGSYVAVSSATLKDGVVTVAYSCTSGACTYGLQLFYDYSTNTAGKNYKLTMTVTSTAAVTIVVNGTSYTLEANKATAIEVTAAEPEVADSAGASISIQISVTNGDSTTLTLSNVTMTEVTDSGSGDSGDATTDTKTITLTFVEIYGDNLYFHFTMSEAITFSYVKVNGTQQWSEVTGTTLKVNAGATITSGTYTFEFIASDGTTVATASYTYAASSGSGDSGTTTGGDTSSNVTTITLTFVEVYGDNYYFHFTMSEAVTCDYVKCNGTQVWSEFTGTTLKVHAGAVITSGTTYTFEFVKDGTTIATATYTYTA